MEGDAGTSRLNPTDDENDTALVGAADVATADSPGDLEDAASSAEPNRGRLGQGWLATIWLALILATGALSAGGYLLLRSNDESEQIARDDVVALQAAKDCVTATQAPDTASMGAAQAKIVNCATGDFGAQAVFYSSMMLEAYQAANVKVEVADLRAAVERHHGDGSVDVLVAVRTKVTNSETADQEQGYRLRVTMQRADGTYKIGNLVQVTT
ncbi:MAG: hypothetical protein ACSLE3_12940 [Microbacteriaceae bacterium]